MGHAYELSANAATKHAHGHTVRYSLVGDLDGARAIVVVKTPGELIDAKLKHGLDVLARNTHEIQHKAVTSPPNPLQAVVVGHRPVTRHGPGFKSLDYGLLVERTEVED